MELREKGKEKEGPSVFSFSQTLVFYFRGRSDDRRGKEGGGKNALSPPLILLLPYSAKKKKKEEKKKKKVRSSFLTSRPG